MPAGAARVGRAEVGAPAARARLRCVTAVRAAGDLPRLPTDRSARGVGSVTSFGYAYLIAAAVVGISASSLGLVTAVPLTRMGLEPRRVARHVEASAWPALLLVAATAGIFAVAGADDRARVLGAAYGDEVGTQIGRLVVAMAPYMVASVALSVTFPLVFVAGRGSRLPVIGLVVLAIHVPARVRRSGGRRARRPRARARGLDGARVRLDADASPRGPLDDRAARGRRSPSWRAVLSAGSCRPACCSARPPAVVVGLLLATGALALVRPVGLRSAWHYLRELA